MWRTYTIPAKGEPGSETWGKLIDYGGGATWLSGTYDPDLNTLYWTTGNPWPDFFGADRGGDNLYSCSLLALDANTGKMKWYFQFTPHDTHDWDAQAWPVLVDLPYHGQDAQTGAARQPQRLSLRPRPRDRRVPERHAGWWRSWIGRAGSMPRDGRSWCPAKIRRRPATASVPSVRGATNWMSPSFDPATGLFYVMTLEQCDIYTSSSMEPEPKKNFSGGGAGPKPAEIGQFFLRAYDPKTGSKKWEYPVVTPTAEAWSGTVSTAGGVVFFGDDQGQLVAVDSRNGEASLALRDGRGTDRLADHLCGGWQAVRRHRVGHGDLFVRAVRAGHTRAVAEGQNRITGPVSRASRL